MPLGTNIPHKTIRTQPTAKDLGNHISVLSVATPLTGLQFRLDPNDLRCGLEIPHPGCQTHVNRCLRHKTRELLACGSSCDENPVFGVKYIKSENYWWNKLYETKIFEINLKVSIISIFKSQEKNMFIVKTNLEGIAD